MTKKRNLVVLVKGRYSKVSRHMWHDERVKRLSSPPPSGFTLFSRFLFGPELTNVPGLFMAWEAGMAQALKWELEAFREAFREVLREGLAEADWEAGLVWVPKAIEHNPPESANVVLSWAATISELPDCELKTRALSSLESHMKQRGKPWEEAWGKACPKSSRKPRGNQEQEQKQEQEQSIEERAEPAAHTPRVDRFMATFAKPSESAAELFGAWRSESGKTGATLDAKRAEFFGRLALEGVTAEQVTECVRGAKLDDWARDRAKLSPSAVLGSAEQREKFAAMARDPPKPRGKYEPPQPNDPNNRYVPRKFVMPDTTT